ncbi:hypothetical protein CIHG_03842 [Coccidioides immitis H538.4]|uniref:Uncharacterized protein n=1 Tax=Coccidioides immitis H538.4 TaxID=396776 RepID=A0A0J8RN91_COCIT|nr:hypothetical protein CIHG_03842 [Coccidioides immitis H538.4]
MDYPRQFELSMKRANPQPGWTDRGACGGGSDTSVGTNGAPTTLIKASLPRLPDRVVPQRPAYIVMSCQVQYLPQQFAQPSMRGCFTWSPNDSGDSLLQTVLVTLFFGDLDIQTQRTAQAPPQPAPLTIQTKSNIPKP